jgi:transposase-like protein
MLMQTNTRPYFSITESVKPSKAHDSRPPRHQYQHYDRLGDDEVDQLVEGYLQGSSIRELAARFECHRETVSKWLTSRGVEMRHLRLTPERIDKAQRLYESGLSLTDGGKAIRADLSAVRRHLMRRGVKMRDSRGRPHGPVRSH